MRARISLLSDTLRNSYWFVPGLMTLAAVLLSYLTVWADGLLEDGELPGWLGDVLFDGNTDGAAEILGTTASSMITVAGVVFSITVVVLTLASAQFGPRLLDSFMRDRGTQVTLGTFVGGFTYSLLVLRALQFGTDGAALRLSVSMALAWALSGVVVLIYYIHHISITIQAPELVDAIAGELVGATERLFPDADRLEHGREPGPDGSGRELPPEDGHGVDALADGYLEVIDLDGLVELARDRDLLVALDTRPGRFVVPGTTVARAWPADRVDDDLAAALAGTMVTGARRSNVQDVDFPVQQLAEIAVRALSPSVNDPYTAITCVDQLSVGLCLLAGRGFPPAQVADADGVVRVVVADPVTFADLVDSAYSQIRQNAAQHAAVHVAIVAALARIAGCVHDPDRLGCLEDQADRVRTAAHRDVADERDLAPLDVALSQLRQAADDVRGRPGRRTG